MFSRSACAVLVFALAVSSVRADAATTQSLSDALRVETGKSCLEPARLVAHVKMWLGSARVDAGLRVHVVSDANDSRRAYFDIEQAGSTRRRVFGVLPESCDDVHAVVGFALALAIDAARLQREWLAANPAFSPSLLLGVQLSAAYAVSPESALGLATSLERSWAPWLSARLDVFGLYMWSQRNAGSAGRFDALLAASSLQACAGGFPDARLRVGLCVGAALGVVHAWGQQYLPNRSGTALWIAARSGLWFELYTRVSPTFGLYRMDGCQ